MNSASVKGKKLLILGASANELSLVERAKSYGIYTIVTDYNTDHTLSPAKDIADEYWDVSWSELDTLEKLCRENNVNGVCAGYSEFRVENQIKLCARLGLPCYSTMEQLEITRDKLKFKNACREAGVPTVKEYACPEAVDSFPVIVKPVDRGGSIGISVATNREELNKAYDYAMEMSVCKQVVIEKFIKGTEINLYYEIRDGEITLLSSSDTIYAAANGIEKIVPSSFVFPSKHHDLMVEKTDPAIRRMIRDVMKIKNGYIFISGFYDRGELMFFETGFRLCGGHLYNYYEEKGSVNNLDLLIFYALTGTAKDVQPLKEKKDLKCVIVRFYSKAGTIAEISGFDAISKMPDNHLALVVGRVGQKCHENNAILSKIASCYFCSEDAGKLKDDVKQAYALAKVVGTEGEDMIYDRMNADVLESWWQDQE